jgi:hypothetical protein
MKPLILALAMTVLLTGCYEEDFGPQQNSNRTFTWVDFDRLEIEDAFEVTITQGAQFSIKAEGDYRNLDDIRMFKSGSTLEIEFEDNSRRQYTTYITITMPELREINFSGAVNATINGFRNQNRFGAALSGASMAQIDLTATQLDLRLSGASRVRLTGEGTEIDASISGASNLSAYGFPVKVGRFDISGASQAHVTVADLITGTVTGASELTYKGSPQVDVESSGGSLVRKY